jgi:hypothetical protein
MYNKVILIVITILILLFVNAQCHQVVSEGFEHNKNTTIKANDPTSYNYGKVVSSNPHNESLIYDNVTGSVMSGTQFMENTGIIAPQWIAPAWAPDSHGPSSLGTLNTTDYENDPRMLYNKCSLSCCSPQYPTPFQGGSDPLVCDKDGNNRYLSSDYNCTNNAGGTGCLCMTEKQVNGLQNGFVDYYTNTKLGY